MGEITIDQLVVVLAEHKRHILRQEKTLKNLADLLLALTQKHNDTVDNTVANFEAMKKAIDHVYAELGYRQDFLVVVDPEQEKAEAYAEEEANVVPFKPTVH